MYTGGIDPGLTGAIAFYCPDIELLEVHDMPVFDIKGKKKLDLYQLGRIINEMAKDTSNVIIEDPHSMPKQGVASSFKFGSVCGAAQQAVASANIPMQLVAPNKWKRDMRLPKDKDASRQRASQLFPKYAHLWSRKKDDGRAEAALLAWYGVNHE